MNNCLVTKLIGNVNNNNIPKLGVFKFHVLNNDSTNVLPIIIEGSSAFTVKIIGSGHFYKGSIGSQTDIKTEIANVTSTSGYRLSSGEYDVEVSNKYNLTKFDISASNVNAIFTFRLEDLIYSNEITVLRVSLLATNLQNIIGNINIITDNFTLADLTWLFTNSSITGDLGDYAKMPFKGSYNNIRDISSYLTGSIESLVENLPSYNYPLFGNTFYFVVNSTLNVTLNGQKINTTYKVYIDDAGNADVQVYSGGTIAATYTKSTGVWSYT